jgi:predicted dehydrogenase
MRRIRWGVMGTAKIATTNVLPAMRRAERSEVVAIASRDPSRAREVAASLGIARAHGSYESLLEDPDVDAVYIPLPNHLHAEWTLRAAGAGKHVLCEKPLAMNASQAREMVEATRRAGVGLMEAFMYRFHPQWTRIRELVAESRLGELGVIQGFFSYRNVDPANIRNVPEFGGGALLDIGCYPINAARMLFDAEPVAATGFVHRHPTFGTDATTSAILDFGGRHAAFTCSTEHEFDQWLHVVGSEGRLLVETPFNPPRDRPARLVLTRGPRSLGDPRPEAIDVSAADQYRIMVDRFSAAVLDGEEMPTSPEDAVGNMRAIDMVLQGGGDGDQP